MGNIEDAKVALDVIARAIDDAVYLDEDAYNQMIPLQQYTRTIEVRPLEDNCRHPINCVTEDLNTPMLVTFLSTGCRMGSRAFLVLQWARGAVQVALQRVS